MKLYMIPFAGGSCYSYRPLEQLIEEKIDTQVFELPGRGKRILESFVENHSEAVDDICRQMDVYNAEEFAFFGHSMGAILAYLVTIRLKEEGKKLPKHLFLAGHRAPNCRQRSIVKHELPKKEFISELQKLEGVPKQLLEDPETMDFFEPLIRADFRVIEGYCQNEIVQVPVPITLFMGDKDDITNKEKENWKSFTSENFIYDEYVGGHFFIYQHKDQIMKTILDSLES